MKRTIAILFLFAACLASGCDSEPQGQSDETNNPSAQSAAHFTSRPVQYIAPASASPVEQEAEQRYWITTKSRVRHNSSCRYYENSNGRPCGPNEGRACKICGG